MSRKRHTASDEPYFTVRTAANTFASGASLAAHSHAWGQLIYATSGVLSVWTSQGSWVAPPHWAVWAPAGVPHSMRFTGPTSLRTLYLRPGLPHLPKQSTVIPVSPLLRELILRSVDLRMLDRRSAVHRALTSLVLSELRQHPVASLDLPLPTSGPLRQVADHLVSAPAVKHRHRTLARRFGISVRTLERGFLKETGLTMGRWSRRVRFLHAIRQLGAGVSVKEAALASGYQSASAFIAAFRSVFSTTPARYFDAKGRSADNSSGTTMKESRESKDAP
jgi:AraC-like DNA-binding protein